MPTFRLTRDTWLEIGEKTGWAEGIGFGLERFKFVTGPKSKCVCPHCGHMKSHVRMMPCEKLTCPRCGHCKMELRYVEKGQQMSPQMFGG